MDERIDRRASRSDRRVQARDAAQYARQLDRFGAFTLRQFVWPGQPDEPIAAADVYRSADPKEVGELRRLLVARQIGMHCMCMGSAAIKLEGGPGSLELSLHHGESVRWLGAKSGDFELEHGRQLAE